MDKFYANNGNVEEGIVRWPANINHENFGPSELADVVVETVDAEFFDEGGSYFCEFGGAYLGLITQPKQEGVLSRIIKDAKFPDEYMYCILRVWQENDHVTLSQAYGDALLAILKRKFLDELNLDFNTDSNTQTHVERLMLKPGSDPSDLCTVMYIQFANPKIPPN